MEWNFWYWTKYQVSRKRVRNFSQNSFFDDRRQFTIPRKNISPCDDTDDRTSKRRWNTPLVYFEFRNRISFPAVTRPSRAADILIDTGEITFVSSREYDGDCLTWKNRHEISVYREPDYQHGRTGAGRNGARGRALTYCGLFTIINDPLEPVCVANLS